MPQVAVKCKDILFAFGDLRDHRPEQALDNNDRNQALKRVRAFRLYHRQTGSNVSQITLGTDWRQSDRNPQDRSELWLEMCIGQFPSIENGKCQSMAAR